MTEFYTGATNERGERFVWSDDLLLDPCYHVRIHSKTGFNWGYDGSAPRQLSLAILCDLVGSELAQEHEGEFCRKIIARIDSPEWKLASDFVLGWLSARIGYDAVMRAIGWAEMERGGS